MSQWTGRGFNQLPQSGTLTGSPGTVPVFDDQGYLVSSEVTTAEIESSTKVLSLSEVVQQNTSDIANIIVFTSSATLILQQNTSDILTNATEIGAIRVNTDSVAVNVALNTSDLVTVFADISSINATDATQTSEIVALQVTTTSQATLISTNASDIASTLVTVNSVAAHVTQNTSDIVTANANTTSLTTTVNSVAAHVTVNTANILVNASSLAKLTSVTTDSTTTGSTTTLLIGDILYGIVRLTNGSLVSFAGIPAGAAGQFITVENKTGASISVLNQNAGASAANRIFTGTGASITMANNATLIFVYDATSSSWMVAGGSGGGTSPLTTKGDIYTRTSTTDTRHAVPVDYGYVVADSTTGDGWRSQNYTETEGKPGKNYIQYPDFENNSTTGWSLGTIGTLTNGLPTGSPTFGSGASGSLSFTTSNTNPLSGVYSGSYASSSATTAGDMLSSSAYAIDNSDQAKVLTYSFNYQAALNPSNGNWSGTSSNSFGVAARDETNSVWLPVTGAFNLVQSSGVGRATGTFQTGATTASIRLCLYNVNASSGAITLLVDDFYVGPQTSPIGPVVTDWVAYTPTLTNFGTASGLTAKSRRVGDSLECYMSGQFGTGTAAVGALSVGFNGANSNVTIDTSKVPSGGIIGSGTVSGASTTFFGITILAPTSNGTSVNIGNQNSSSGGISAVNGNTTNITGQYFSIHFTVPIVGWSSNSSMSSDTDTRVVEFNGVNSGTSSIAGTNLDLPWTALTDTHGAFSGTTYTIPVSGKYQVLANIPLNMASSGSNTITTLKKNGSTQQTTYLTNGSANDVRAATINWTDQYSAGDILKINVQSTAGATISLLGSVVSGNQATFSVSRLSGPAVIAATESINGRYYACSTSLTASDTTMTYSTKDFDTHGTYASGTLTIPVSGKYEFNAKIATTDASGAQIVGLSLYKNGTQVSQDVVSGLTTASVDVLVTDILSCLAGDLITVRAKSSGTTPSLVSSNFRNYFSWARVGN